MPDRREPQFNKPQYAQEREEHNRYDPMEPQQSKQDETKQSFQSSMNSSSRRKWGSNKQTDEDAQGDRAQQNPSESFRRAGEQSERVSEAPESAV